MQSLFGFLICLWKFSYKEIDVMIADDMSKQIMRKYGSYITMTTTVFRVKFIGHFSYRFMF